MNLKSVVDLRLSMVIGWCAVFLASDAWAATTNYAFTGGIQTFTVPTGVTTVTITAVGAGGGLVTAGKGGSGATLSGMFPVSGGDVLTVFVGGRGSGIGADSRDGAGGGGGSAVVRNSATVLVAAGGGGGAGRGGAGAGGLADTNTVAAGGTGGNDGGGGGGFGFAGGAASGGASYAGGAASLTTFSSGGTGSGSTYTQFGGPGGGGFGGGGASFDQGGGGGGGYSGGAGAPLNSGPQGQGGDSYFDSSGTLISATPGTSGAGNTNGLVTLTYSAPLPTAAFSGLTASQSAIYGTTSIILAGTVSYSGSPNVYPASGETITVTINGNAQTTNINDSTGDFSFSYNPQTVPASGTAYTITYSYAGDANLSPASNTNTALTIAPKALTAQGTLSITSKVYDGTSTAAPTGAAALQGNEALGTGTTSDGKPYSVDSVSLTGTASYAYNDSSVASATTVTESGLSLTGAGSSNYTLTAPTLSATITPKTLTYTGLLVPSSKVYDGTTTASVSGTAALQSAETTGTGSTSDGTPYSVDSVSLTGTATGTYDSKDVVSATTVTFGGLSLSGTGSGNYSLTAGTQAATVNPLPVTLTGARMYDGTATAASGILSITDAVGGDDVNLTSGSATLASSWVGLRAISSDSGLTLGGLTAPNYTLVGGAGQVTILNPHASITIATPYIDNTGTNLVLIWNSIPGVAYQAQGSADLNTWTNTGGSISATGTVTTNTEPFNISMPPSFFRIFSD